MNSVLFFMEAEAVDLENELVDIKKILTLYLCSHFLPSVGCEDYLEIKNDSKEKLMNLDEASTIVDFKISLVFERVTHWDCLMDASILICWFTAILFSSLIVGYRCYYFHYFPLATVFYFLIIFLAFDLF